MIHNTLTVSSFFLFNNLHFSLEILGALTFLVVAWLTLDAFLVRKDFTTASRGIGFGLLALWQVIHAFGASSDIWHFVGYGVYIAGLLFILWNLTLEAPKKRPEFKGIILLPAAAALVLPTTVIVTIGLFLITLLAFNQYKKELKKALFPFLLGFLFLTLGSASSFFYSPDSLNSLWILGHVLEFAGFAALSFWVWSYLQLRIREEMLLIFVSLTLFMSIVVSLTFASVLINKIEIETRANLLTNVRVLDFYILHLEEEALAKVKFLAKNEELIDALLQDDFVTLDTLSKQLSTEEDLGFLTILDGEGAVVLRAYAPSQKGENISTEISVAAALRGDPFVTVERASVEGFSIRAAAPIFRQEQLLGVIVAGFPLDNVLADSIKKVTGLEMSIFDNDTRVATTVFNPDGRTRSVGIRQTNTKVLRAVLEEGKGVTLRTMLLSRPFIASYLPLTDTDGVTVGMLAAAKPQAEILETAQATNRLTLIVVMIVMLILIMPIYSITRRLGQEIH